MSQSIFDFMLEVFNVILSIGNTIWEILTTPVMQYVSQWQLPDFLDFIIGTPLKFIFGENGTILSFLPVIFGILVIIRIVLLFRK